MDSPTIFQRVEGAAILGASAYLYFSSGFSLLVYLLLFFTFDISTIGYFASTKLGAVTYNIGHSFIIPAILVICYVVTNDRFLLQLACIWASHIGFDREMSFGLKFEDGFRHTHLGNIGKK